MNMPRFTAVLAAVLITAPFGVSLAQETDAPIAAAPPETAPEAPSGPGPAPPPRPVLPPAEVGVQVSSLAAPDGFTTAGRETGLPATLWRGASVRTARSVLPLLSAKPLSPAAAQLARRVLATGAQGPDGAAQAPGLA